MIRITRDTMQLFLDEEDVVKLRDQLVKAVGYKSSALVKYSHLWTLRSMLNDHLKEVAGEDIR